MPQTNVCRIARKELEIVTQFEKTDLIATRCCFELRAKTCDQPIIYQFLQHYEKLLSFAYLL